MDIPRLLPSTYCHTGVDKGASTLLLIHFTLREYLGTHPELVDTAQWTNAKPA